MKRRTVTILIVCAVVLVAAGTLIMGRSASAKTKQEAVYKTAKIARGDIEETVSSTGNLRAVGTVNVLAQLTGTLEKVYVDFNDTVTKNQPLAEINTDKLKITLKEAAAAKDKAQAQAEYDAAEYEKSRSLQASKLISDSDFAAKRLAYLSSKAALEQAEASYDEARLNIDKYAIVLSPITGIVLDRAVEEGETVVGSGNTNTQLFTLAENLRQMEIEAAVDEMDISRIKLGQSVRFTVEAYPDKKFSGSVSQIRIVPISSNNVVSYTVIVRADNADGFLLPGMTATVDFLVNQKKDVILVPSAAFRFTPADDVVAAARRKAFESRIANLSEAERAKAIKEYDARVGGGGQQAGSLLGGARRFPGGGGPGGPGGPGGSGSTGSSATRKTLWILEADGTVTLRAVETGASDGTNTEIVNGDALSGLAAIVRGQ
jgi:HlyD family secretion protein